MTSTVLNREEKGKLEIKQTSQDRIAYEMQQLNHIPMKHSFNKTEGDILETAKR